MQECADSRCIGGKIKFSTGVSKTKKLEIFATKMSYGGIGLVLAKCNHGDDADNEIMRVGG